MGREIRIVSKNWVHPKDVDGNYIPLFDGANLDLNTEKWDLANAKWKEGKKESFFSGTQWEDIGDNYEGMSYSEYAGERPNKEEYMPFSKDNNAFQLYENVTEGTPISPVLNTKEEMRDWLANNGYDPFKFEEDMKGEKVDYMAQLKEMVLEAEKPLDPNSLSKDEFEHLVSSFDGNTMTSVMLIYEMKDNGKKLSESQINDLVKTPRMNNEQKVMAMCMLGVENPAELLYPKEDRIGLNSKKEGLNLDQSQNKGISQ